MRIYEKIKKKTRLAHKQEGKAFSVKKQNVFWTELVS